MPEKDQKFFDNYLKSKTLYNRPSGNDANIYEMRTGVWNGKPYEYRDPYDYRPRPDREAYERMADSTYNSLLKQYNDLPEDSFFKSNAVTPFDSPEVAQAYKDFIIRRRHDELFDKANRAIQEQNRTPSFWEQARDALLGTAEDPYTRSSRIEENLTDAYEKLKGYKDITKQHGPFTGDFHEQVFKDTLPFGNPKHLMSEGWAGDRSRPENLYKSLYETMFYDDAISPYERLSRIRGLEGTYEPHDYNEWLEWIKRQQKK